MTAQRKEYKKELTGLFKQQRRLDKEINLHQNVIVRIERARLQKARKATVAYNQTITRLDREANLQTRKITAYIRAQVTEHAASQRRIAILEGRLSS